MTKVTSQQLKLNFVWRLLTLLLLVVSTAQIWAAEPECKTYTIQPGQTLTWPLRSTTAPDKTTPEETIKGIHNAFPHHISNCFILQNTSPSVLALSIYLKNPRMNHAELNAESDDGVLSLQIGTDYPLPLWSTPSADSRFPADLQPGQKIRYELLIGSKATYNSSINIIERESLRQSLAFEKNIAGALAGMIGILSIYFLFLSISARDKTYFYLAGSTVSVTLMQLNDLGLLFPLWPTSTYWNQNSSAFFAVLSTLFGNCLARHYLDTRTNMPRTDKILNGFGWYMFLFTLPLSLANKPDLLIPFFALPALLFMLTLLAISIARLNQGFLPARLYLLAYLLPLISGILILLITIGAIPTSPLSHLFPISGTAIQLILFALALGERINWLSEERNIAHLTALQTKTETQTKRHFLAQISHELRTPLIGIIGLSELIQRQHYSKNDIQLIDGMESSARHLLNITNTLLDHARLDAGKWTAEFTTMTIPAILQSLVTEIQPTANDKHLTISTHIHENVPKEVTGDPIVLKRILQELLDNALKFTDSGSITITVERLPTEEQSGNSPNDSSALLRFTVIDTGTGFDSGFQSRIFELFELADISSTRLQQGSGLGLSLCKKFCRLLGGKIGCESQPDKGSRFWFTLPFTLVDHHPEEPVNAPLDKLDREFPQQLQPGKHILIAEDDAAIQMIVTALLSKIGYQNYVVFDNGQQLFTYYCQHHANTAFVLLDWNMPVLDGQETLHALRAFEADNNLPPVAAAFMSAHDSQSYLSSLCDKNTAILYKPLTTSALEKLLGIHQDA